MECLTSQAKSTHLKASIKTMTKLLIGDQGPAFQAHSLQITLLGPFTYEPNVILGSFNNRVPTNTILKKSYSKNKNCPYLMEIPLSPLSILHHNQIPLSTIKNNPNSI